MPEIPDEDFLIASGMAGTLRLVAEGGGGLPTEVWAGSRPFVVIGRDANADLHLDHGTISRRHVYLQAVEGRLFGIDLGSRTGVRLRGKPWRAGWLDAGDILGVGSYEVRIEESGTTNRAEGFAADANRHDPLSSCYKARNRLPGVSLEISAASGVPTLWRMGRVMVLVGSSPDCKLRIDDQNVAAFHCGLIRTEAGPWVVDLLGEGGTFLNGNYVRSARLEHGDGLQVGPAMIRIRLDDPTPNGRGRAIQPLGPSATPTTLATRELRTVHSANGPRFSLIPFAEGGAASNDTAVQFGLIQQQMFDQFHQVMTGVIQSFGAMHREQMGAVREDLDRLDQITQELQELRSKQADATDTLARGSSSGVDNAVAEKARGVGTPHPGGGLDGTWAEFEEAGLTSGTPRVGNARENGGDTSPPPATASKLDPIEILRKVQELQQARQGHWQRIVGFLFGAP